MGATVGAGVRTGYGLCRPRLRQGANGNFTQESLINPNIPVVIGPINPLITSNVVGVQEMLSLYQTVLLKANITDAMLSYARIFRTPGKVNRTETDGATPRDVNYS